MPAVYYDIIFYITCTYNEVIAMDLQFIINILNTNYHIHFDNISLLRDGPGYVCTVNSGNKRFVLKNYRNTYIERGVQSLKIMSYLNKAGYQVPAIIPTNQGLSHFYFTYEDDKRIGALFEFIVGIDPYHIAIKDASTIGRCVARMQNLMQKYTGRLVSQDRFYFVDYYIQKLYEKKYPTEKIKEFAEYGNELWEKVKTLPRGFCHGDLHTGNMILTPTKEYYIVDFDLASYSFPAFDIMTLCDRTNYFDFKPNGIDKVTRMIDEFSKGYCPIRKITEKEFTAVYHFIAIRHYQLQAIMIDLYGLDCVDEKSIDKHLEWIKNWREQCEKRNIR